MMQVSSPVIQKLGMGEYPGYYCYDKDRPSWLPYWLDDFTESKCKWSPSTIVGNIVACTTGDPTCGTPSQQAQNPNVSGPGVAKAGEPTNIPRCSQFETFNPDTNQCEFGITKPSTLIVAGLAVFAAMMLKG